MRKCRQVLSPLDGALRLPTDLMLRDKLSTLLNTHKVGTGRPCKIKLLYYSERKAAMNCLDGTLPKYFLALFVPILALYLVVWNRLRNGIKIGLSLKRSVPGKIISTWEFGGQSISANRANTTKFWFHFWSKPAFLQCNWNTQNILRKPLAHLTPYLAHLRMKGMWIWRGEEKRISINTTNCKFILFYHTILEPSITILPQTLCNSVLQNVILQPHNSVCFEI